MVNERCFNGSVTGCTSTLTCFFMLTFVNFKTPKHQDFVSAPPVNIISQTPMFASLSVIIMKPKYHSHSHIRSMISCFSCVSFPWRHTVTAPSSLLICCCICFATAPYCHWSKQTKKKKSLVLLFAFPSSIYFQKTTNPLLLNYTSTQTQCGWMVKVMCLQRV